MSDQAAYVPSDGDIHLDLSDVESIQGWMPVPSGVYTLQVEEPHIVPTKNGGKQIEFKNRVVEGPMANRGLGIERIFIPDRERQTPDAYKTTAGYFKGKIEAMTGVPYAGTLNVRALAGLRYKALVLLVDEGYGPQNKLQTYLPLSADTSGIVIPQGVTVQKRKDGGNGAGGETQDTAGAGRFKI